VCLVARHLEANGIPTMCLASALDIIEAGKPPRATFVDYPLGHTSGRPLDEADQLSVVREGLRGLESMTMADRIRHLPNQWGDDDWRAEGESTEGDDTRQPRDETPQFQYAADRDAAVAAGAL
jgi:hypothetical protein